MVEFKMVINKKLTFSAAGKIARIAGNYPGRVTLWKDLKMIDLKNPLSIISVRLKKDDTIIIRVQGDHESTAAESIKEIIKQNA